METIIIELHEFQSDTLRKVSKVNEAVQHSCFFAQPRRLRSRRKLVKFFRLASLEKASQAPSAWFEKNSYN